MRLLQSLQRRFNGTSITIVVIGARSGRPVLSECRRSVFPVLPDSGVNASCVAVLCVSSVRVLLSHRLKFRRSARSSSSIGQNRSQYVLCTVVHASGVSFGGSVLKAHTSAALHFVVRQALTQAIKIQRSL